MYYIGLDVHKKTISYCVKDASGQVHREFPPYMCRSPKSDVFQAPSCSRRRASDPDVHADFHIELGLPHGTAISSKNGAHTKCCLHDVQEPG
jgi:hypothetical protein